MMEESLAPFMIVMKSFVSDSCPRTFGADSRVPIVIAHSSLLLLVVLLILENIKCRAFGVVALPCDLLCVFILDLMTTIVRVILDTRLPSDIDSLYSL